MKITKYLILGSLAVASMLFVPTTQASDHHRHHGDRHGSYHHHHHGYYGGGPDYYYDDQPGVVYGGPYYGTPGVTFAFGGHHYRHHRHWR